MALSPAEEARQASSAAWTHLDFVQSRIAELAQDLSGQGHQFNAAGMTAALQAFNRLDQANHILDVDQAIEAGLV